MELTVGDVVAATEGQLSQGDASTKIVGFATDTRIISAGNAFVALAGEDRDGHQFCADAIECGAACLVVSNDLSSDILSQNGTHGSKYSSIAVVSVPDTLGALGDIAALVITRHKGIRVGITGSTGKTSCKDMLFSILSRRHPVCASYRSFNNEIGVPLTILNASTGCNIMILEMGMRGRGDIAHLAALARPSIGVITRVGKSHIGRLGSIESVAAAKSELIYSLPAEGIAVLNTDDGMCDSFSISREGRTICFGSKESANVRYSDVSVALSDSGGLTSFTLHTPVGEIDVTLPVLGAHQVENATAASAAAIALEVPIEDIKAGLESVTLSPMRMQLMRSTSGGWVINDAYNANPESMSAAIQTLGAISGDRKMVVLGDMLELGEHGRGFHNDIGIQVAGASFDSLVAVGELGSYIADAAISAGMSPTQVSRYPDADTAAASIEPAEKDQVVLVKASRSVGLESVAAKLAETTLSAVGGG